jgi:hypothetical protein
MRRALVRAAFALDAAEAAAPRRKLSQAAQAAAQAPLPDREPAAAAAAAAAPSPRRRTALAPRTAAAAAFDEMVLATMERLTAHSQHESAELASAPAAGRAAPGGWDAVTSDAAAAAAPAPAPRGPPLDPVHLKRFADMQAARVRATRLGVSPTEDAEPYGVWAERRAERLEPFRRFVAAVGGDPDEVVKATWRVGDPARRRAARAMMAPPLPRRARRRADAAGGDASAGAETEAEAVAADAGEAVALLRAEAAAAASDADAQAADDADSALPASPWTEPFARWEAALAAEADLEWDAAALLRRWPAMLAHDGAQAGPMLALLAAALGSRAEAVALMHARPWALGQGAAALDRRLVALQTSLGGELPEVLRAAPELLAAPARRVTDNLRALQARCRSVAAFLRAARAHAPELAVRDLARGLDQVERWLRAALPPAADARELLRAAPALALWRGGARSVAAAWADLDGAASAAPAWRGELDAALAAAARAAAAAETSGQPLSEAVHVDAAASAAYDALAAALLARPARRRRLRFLLEAGGEDYAAPPPLPGIVEALGWEDQEMAARHPGFAAFEARALEEQRAARSQRPPRAREHSPRRAYEEELEEEEEEEEESEYVEDENGDYVVRRRN